MLAVSASRDLVMLLICCVPVAFSGPVGSVINKSEFVIPKLVVTPGLKFTLLPTSICKSGVSRTKVGSRGIVNIILLGIQDNVAVVLKFDLKISKA